MMYLSEEIENRFALQSDYSAYGIKSLDQHYPAWVIRLTDGAYGVAIEYNGAPVAERFSGARLETLFLNIDIQESRQYLVLICSNPHFRHPFSVLCAEFVEPGDNGEKRSSLKENPLLWWTEWKELLGNKTTEDMVYDIIGELLTVLKLCESGREDAYWTASRLNTHDVEMEDMSYEVKSTVKKDRAIIHVNSQFQLKSHKPLYLVFIRLEESGVGVSIDDILIRISKYQYDHIDEYDDYLTSRGLPHGNHSRKKKYTILERRKYAIDSDFPLLREEDFKNDKYPDSISHIEYDINLDGIPYENWR